MHKSTNYYCTKNIEKGFRKIFKLVTRQKTKGKLY